ncbi:proprotein convertase P-domain-containing protein [Mariniblastus fucicola]|uniref:Fungalysin metallopeptidase (M36) n=1 Tax=Mariniblastus fucicola TaxID=980251 RepID=A0A5B9PG61_9BACT|nr:proprotein convertase P-domain-containing protein [Mariniblastus fucicola]QEG21753.1 Fungalysin metallopeptidase (M36) [Mariniblastus fucicola]
MTSSRSRSRARFSYGPLEQKRLLAADLSTATTAEASYYLEDFKQESVARTYLDSQTETADLQTGDVELRLVEIQRGLASTVTRFQQTVHGVPVADAWVATIQGPTGDFVHVHDQSVEAVFDASCEPGKTSINFELSEEIALEYAGAKTMFADTRGELVWLPGEGNDKSASLVWQTTVFAVRDGSVDDDHDHDDGHSHSENEHGDFLTYIDAFSGEVISQENRISHFTEGSGDVFYPNPYQTLGSDTGITDNNDANSTALENQHISVTLEGLDEGTGLIKGEFVDLSTLNSSTITDVDADEADRVYEYTRDDPRFEQVQIYHTVDQINRYFHDLGFDDDTGTPNGIRDFPTLANAHWFTDDQSFYSSGNDAIHFGDGGVDDGEDGDIIAHEYGHAIQNNQNAAWGGGEMGAMGEGFGDYLAASFFQNVGDAAFQATHAAAVGEWDATSYSSDNPPNLRRVDGNKMYPTDLVGQVHADGEIWSRALWDLNQDIGAAAADQLVLESHFLLPGSSSMVTAAEMILMADENLNGGLYESNIRAAFEARGILEAPETIGVVSFDSSVYAVGDTIEIDVADGNAPSNIQVVVTSSNGDSETLSLTGSGSYSTSIVSVEGAVTADDGQLQAAIGDTITVSYFDADDGAGDSFTATDTAVFQNISVYHSEDTPTPINDNSTITSTITIADEGNLLDVDLLLDITHTWDGDLTAVLTAPGGQQFTLFDRIGSSGDNFTDTLFDDDAPDSIDSGTAPYTGTFRPNDAFTSLVGTSITGDWVLSISDAATQDTGSLNNWSLYIVVEIDEPVGPITDSNSATNTVAEDAAIGASVGVTASATDPNDDVTYSLTADAGGLFDIDPVFGVVTVAGALDFESAATHTVTVRADSDDGSFSEADFDIAVTNVNDAVVTTRQLFYLGSDYDTGDAFDSVATDKQFLLPGETATFANYSSYSLGINGLALELNDLNQVPTLANIGDFFDFKVGNDDTTADWTDAPAPISLDYVSNVDASGTDQIVLQWADNAIENQWLQITVNAGNTTGLAAPDVFYFGNAIGETGDSTTDARVDADDVSRVRQNLSGFFSVGIDNVYDFDRDSRVDADDVSIARQNLSGFFPIRLITPGAGKADFGSGSDLLFDAAGDDGKPTTSKEAGLAKRSIVVQTNEKVELSGAIVADNDVAVVESPAQERVKAEAELDRAFVEFDFEAELV